MKTLDISVSIPKHLLHGTREYKLENIERYSHAVHGSKIPDNYDLWGYNFQDNINNIEVYLTEVHVEFIPKTDPRWNAR